MATPMGILRIERAVYGVTDVALCERFFADFGLDRGAGTHPIFTTRTGQRVELRPADDPDLPPPLEAESTLREVVWGVADQAELDRLTADLATDRQVRTGPDGTVHTTDETGFGLGLAVAAPVEIKHAAPADNSHGGIERWNQPLEAPQRVQPWRMCHIALNIPKAGRERAVDFYLDRLGFVATDRVLDMGVFMRAEGDDDQHTLLLCHRPDRAGVNHTAYEVASFDEVVVGANHMIEQGWHEARRLGRHTIGSNVFRFIHAPCGGRVEFAADMDRVDDTYQTRTWQTAPPHTLWAVRTTRGEGA